MLASESDKPGLDEQYIVATNTSDLTLQPDRVCAATHLIAAGLVGNRMGEALAHLRSEWAASAKPRKATEAEIAAKAATLPKAKGKLDLRRARAVLLVEYAAAMRKRAHALRGWAGAMRLMAQWAAGRGVDPDLLSPALYHWLSPTCPVCDGHGVMRLQHAPVLGAKQCGHCAGTGRWPRPLGAHEVHAWLNRCAKVAGAGRRALVRGGPIFG